MDKISPYGLLQEQFYKRPWRLLIACIMLNLTTRSQVDKVIHKFFKLCPKPQDAIRINKRRLVRLLRPLGLVNRRVQTIKKFSEDFIKKDWSYPIELYGIGKYANDSYLLFCTDEWQTVKPTDYALKFYVTWLRNGRGGEI